MGPLRIASLQSAGVPGTDRNSYDRDSLFKERRLLVSGSYSNAFFAAAWGCNIALKPGADMRRPEVLDSRICLFVIYGTRRAACVQYSESSSISRRSPDRGSRIRSSSPLSVLTAAWSAPTMDHTRRGSMYSYEQWSKLLISG